MTRSALFAALAAGVIGAGVLGAATTAQAQYYYYPDQPYYGPPPGYGYAPRGYRPAPPPVYYDKDTAKSVARNWKEQQKARIKSGYYNQPQYYYAPQPRYQGYTGYVDRRAPHDRAPYYAPPQNHY